MANFTVRVELHDANGSDYESLHEAMEAEGFSRTIKDSNGTKYQLPDAEHIITTHLERSSVLNITKRAAHKTYKEFSVLVTESKGRTWFSLPKT